MISFEYPWLLLLAFAPLLVRMLAGPHREPQPYLSIPFLADLSAVSGRSASSGAAVSRGSMLQRAVLAIAFLLLLVSVARPQWIHEPVTKTLPGRDLLIAVDLSGSMETTDFTDKAGQRTDRLSAVKEIMDEFLARREGDRVGLMFFGSAPFMQVPFTSDLNVCRALLQEARARMAGPQTMLGDAVGKAISVFENSEVKEKVLIVLTDGNDTGSLVPPVKAAEIARDKGIMIHTIGMGDPASVGEEKLDVDTLQAMARSTGGEMFLAIDRNELAGVYDQIDAMTTRQVETLSYRPVTDLFHFPLSAAIILVMLYHAGRLWRVRAGAKAAGSAELTRMTRIEQRPEPETRAA